MPGAHIVLSFSLNNIGLHVISQVWDVLTNKEVVDIVASASSRSSAARSLVESAVRSWRYKYPTSKVDDCAVVCLFLSDNSDNVTASSINSISSDTMSNVNKEGALLSALEAAGSTDGNKQQELSSAVKAKGKGKGMGGEFSDELENAGTGLPLAPSDGNSISIMEGDEWSALEGVSRVNTMLTLPRFNVPGQAKSKKLV